MQKDAEYHAGTHIPVEGALILELAFEADMVKQARS